MSAIPSLVTRLIRLDKSARLIAAGLILTASAGCTLGPNYRAPKTAAPKTWSAVKSPSLIATDPAAETKLARWWTVFNDPELDQLVDRAIAANLDVKAAGLRLEEARALLSYVRAGYFPSVSAGLGADYRRLSTSTKYPVAGGLSNNFQAGFDASWELDVFGGTRRAVESTKAIVEAEEDERQAAVVTLLGDLGNDYATLRATQARLQIAQRNLAVEEQILEFTQARSDHGLASELDVAEAQAQVDTLQSDIPDFQAAISQQEYAIAELLGEQPDSLQDELAATPGILTPPPSLPAEIPSEVLRNRPDVKAAERALASATAGIGAAEAAYFPTFTIDPSLDIQAGWLHKLLSAGSLAWAVPLSVQMPIFDSGKIAAEISLAKSFASASLITYQKTVLTAFREVETSLAGYQAAKARLDSLTAAAAADQTALDRATDLYRNGIGDFITVLDNERSLYAAQDAVAQGQLSIAVETIALYKALGCGWQSAPPPAPPNPKHPISG